MLTNTDYAIGTTNKNFDFLLYTTPVVKNKVGLLKLYPYCTFPTHPTQ